MRFVFKVAGIRNYEDVSKIKKAIIKHEGIVACQINKEKSKVDIIYDNYFVNEDNIIESIEDLGYTVI